MTNQKSRMYLKWMKTLQRVQKVCDWMNIPGFLIILLGFITSVFFFICNTFANATIVLLISGLGILCLSSVTAELARLCALWMYQRYQNDLIREKIHYEDLNKLFIDITRKQQRAHPNVIKQHPYLKDKTASR